MDSQSIPEVVEASRVQPKVTPPKAEASAASQETAAALNSRIEQYKRGAA